MVPNSKSNEGDTAEGKPPCLQPPSALWWGSHLRVLAYLHQCMLSPEGCEMHSFFTSRKSLLDTCKSGP